MAEAEAEWTAKANAIWNQGGVRPAEVDDLLEVMQQFQWGEADPSHLASAHNSIQSAKDWYSDVQVSRHHAITCAGVLPGVTQSFATDLLT